MTVKELIAALQKMPNQDTDVMIDLYDSEGNGAYSDFSIDDQDGANGGPCVIAPDDLHSLYTTREKY